VSYKKPWQPAPQSGLIGYFDILGYQAFLEKNSLEYVVKTSISKLVGLKFLMPGRLFEWWAPIVTNHATPKAVYKCATDNMNWLVFSDTVLLTLALPRCTNKEKLAYYILFLTQCTILWEEMLKAGFPLRGVLGYGKFIVYEGCFAGKPIIDAYKLASKLDFAGCVCSEATSTWTKRILQNEGLQGEPACVDYMAPLNIKKASGDMRRRRLKAVNVLLHKTPRDLFALNYEECVRNSFGAHRKKIDHKVRRKIRNTIAYLVRIREIQQTEKGFLKRKSLGNKGKDWQSKSSKS
jgi:hypothetical protein